MTGQCLDKVSSFKYLGIFIDIHFSWHDHTDHVSDKASKNINITSMIKRFLFIQCLINIYHPLVNPYPIFYTLFQNGRSFSALLFTCKLALVASFTGTYSFEIERGNKG